MIGQNLNLGPKIFFLQGGWLNMAVFSGTLPSARHWSCVHWKSNFFSRYQKNTAMFYWTPCMWSFWLMTGWRILCPLRSTLSPEWSGNHGAVLDGDQGKVSLSWSIENEYINFKVEQKLSMFSTRFKIVRQKYTYPWERKNCKKKHRFSNAKKIETQKLKLLKHAETIRFLLCYTSCFLELLK